MLGVLRDDEGASYAPAPGLADLDRLVHDVGAAGLEVRRRARARATELPPGVDFTAYRIVQEALTNVLKHAGPAQRDVVVGYEPRRVALEIVDDGRGVNGARAERRPRTDGHARASRCVRRLVRSRSAHRRRVPRRRDDFPTESDVIRVAVADDQALVRSGFAVLLRSADDIDVVGEASDGARSGGARHAERARRDPHGHPHAGDGRARGDPPDHLGRRDRSDARC